MVVSDAMVEAAVVAHNENYGPLSWAEWMRRALEAALAVRASQDEPDDGYEVMCEPVAAMVEEVRAALVPVQQDEPEGVCAFPNCSCTENRCPGVGGEPCRGCGVPTGVGAYHHIGCRTPEPNPVPVQQDELQITPNKSKDLESGPVQQDEPEDDHWHWLDDRTGRIYHEGDVFGVRSGRDVTLHRLRCTCDPVPEWIVDNAEAKGWDLSPDVAPLPRPRPPRSHRDDESLRRWEARHPSVRFRPAVPLEQECEHVWRSSFGDTFCEKCNQDAPVEIASERCRTCKGSGTWADEGWSKPPQPCKACSGSGLAPIRKRKPTVPVQQDEPEGVCAFPNCSCTENRCPAKGERGPFCDHGFHPRLCGRCAPVPEAVTDEDEVQCQMCKTVQPRPDKECGHCGAGPKYLCPIHTRPAAAPVQQEPERSYTEKLMLSTQRDQRAVPSVGLRDRVRDEIWRREWPEFTGTAEEVESDRHDRLSSLVYGVLSVLLEAGTQEDEDDGYEVMCEPVAAMVEEVRAALVPVQQDEPEAWAATENFDPQPGDFLFGSDGQAYMFRKGGWHRYPERDRAATGTTEYSPTVPVQQDEPEADSEFFEKGETGEPPTEEELAFIRESAEDVYESGLPDIEAVPVQQEPERSALGSDEDFRNAVKAYPPLAVSSVGLRDRIACELANLEYERSGRLCETEDFYADADRVLSVHEAGTQEDEELAALRRRVVNQRKELDALRRAHSGTRAVEVAEEANRYRTALSNIRFRMNGGGELSPATLRSIVDVALRAPAVSGTPDTGQRQRREMFDTFAPTEPTVDDLQRSPAEAGTQEDET